MFSEAGKVLIVDDIPENIDILHQILTAKNYSVAGVPSGKLALEVVKRFWPDVILLDVMMPEMDGFETCRRLKADPLTSKIPVIFVTAKTSSSDIAQGFQSGGADYITKPARQEEVWARVGHQVALKRLLEHKSQLIEQLEQMERRNREIIFNATDPMIVCDQFYIIESVNPATIQMLGYQNAQLIGRSFIDLVEPKYRDDIARCFEDLSICKDICDDQDTREIEIVNHNGDNIHTDMSISVIGDSKAKFLVMLHDLTLHHSLVQELKKQSYVDKLTNLANRRKMDEFYSNEWFRCQRNRQPISVLFFDIDHFKRYNDTYGHQAGDDCLMAVANLLAKMISRPADLIARYGGEEFVAVLPETSYEGAMELAEKILDKIRALKIEHKTSGITPYLTVSVGIASSIPKEGINAEGLLDLADKALYLAKNSGRNQIQGKQI